MTYKTEQEAFWAGEFGNAYIDRNQGDALLASNLDFFSKALRATRGLQSCIEFGANIGMNLKAIQLLYPRIQASAIEINAEAAELMHRSSQALHEQTEHLRTQVREVREKTLGYIQHEPVKSVFIAAATGAALVLLSNWLSQRIK